MSVTRAVAVSLLCLLLGGAVTAQRTAGPASPFQSFTDRIYGLALTEEAFSCRGGHVPRRDVNPDALIREYLKTRGLTDEPRTRALVDALLDYQRYPTIARLDLLKEHHAAVGLRPLVAEDIIRCVRAHSPYSREQFDDLAQTLASVPPAPIGLFWAAMSLSWRDNAGMALEYFRRALEADTHDSRTRLFYGIALLKERRAVEAMAIMEPIPRSFAPEATAYSRARALIALNRPREARALLEPLPRWVHTFETTAPGALDALPIPLPTVPGCAIATTYGLEGKETRAREMLVAIKNCPEDLMALELRFGHPFRALEILEEPHAYYIQIRHYSELTIEARARLGACEWARESLGYFDSWILKTDLLRKVDASCPVIPTPATSQALQARLATPRLKSFVERPLARLSDVKRWKQQSTTRSATPSALAQFRVVAISPPAQRMFAVSISSAVDPVRNSMPGLWVHVSSDAGRHWEGPYYLGLSQRFVYDAPRFVAHEPSSHGKRLPLEVQTIQITFPPPASPTQKRTESLEHYMLDIDLDAIRRDADGDGLTDLLEEKLLLDPQARDTDGDGVEDAQDMLPLQPRDADVPPYVRQVWTALLPVLAGDRRLPRDERAPGLPVAIEGTRPLARERTVFIRSSNCPASHASSVRAICLTPELLKLYAAKFGELSPMDLSHIVFDETREHAFVEYAFTSSGGTLRATKRNGTWLFQTISTWIE